MTILICGKYKNKEPEVIDETDNELEAKSLVREYKIAFGYNWHIFTMYKSN